MLKKLLPLSAEGRRLLLKEALAGAALAAVFRWLLPFLLPAFALLLILALGFTLYFFREPAFVPEKHDEGIITAPSYGTVLRAGLENGRPVVRIFLSVFDVHSQYSPVGGTVVRVKKDGDSCFQAFRREASGNYRNLVEIELADAALLGVEQITGILARRISCAVKPGDRLVPGSRLGLIYFGSQVAVYLPEGAEILARPGERVLPCRSVLARLQKP